MIKLILLGGVLLTPAAALACGGKKTMASTTADTEHVATSKDPTACAKRAELVGANCSYTTGMMAQRVLTEGAPWNFTGTLSSSDNTLSSRVAAPFTVGPEGKINLVANEFVEQLTDSGLQSSRVTLDGKRLDVDGVTYFVVTSFSTPNS